MGIEFIRKTGLRPMKGAGLFSRYLKGYMLAYFSLKYALSEDPSWVVMVTR